MFSEKRRGWKIRGKNCSFVSTQQMAVYDLYLQVS